MDKYYAPFMKRAALQIAKDVLTDIMNNGLTGEHYLMLTVDTKNPSVQMPLFLKQKYPHQISLLLQHQFENLSVSEHDFSVDLSFGGIFHTLKIPFSALQIFYDPSCQFILSFEEEKREKEPTKTAEIIDLKAHRKS